MWHQAILYLTILILFKFTEGSWSGYPRYLPGGAACSREHITDSLRGLAACRPRDKVIPVPWPNNTDIHQLSPSHVVVRRCSGGCHGSSSCVALTTRVRQVSVMMGKCPVAGGKCDKECASLEVEDEVECECGCARHLEEECGGKRESHMWSKERCECECRDQEARRQCLESPGKLWSSSSCSCLCNSLTSCPTGLTQDPATCTCQPGLSRPGTGGAGVAPREDRDTAHLLPPWLETVVITALASLVVLLIILCGALLRRIHSLKTKLKLASDGLVSELSDDTRLYLPCTTPDSQININQTSEVKNKEDCLERQEYHPSKIEMYIGGEDCLKRPEYHPSKIEMYSDGEDCSYCSKGSALQLSFQSRSVGYPDLRPESSATNTEISALMGRGESAQ